MHGFRSTSTFVIVLIALAWAGLVQQANAAACLGSGSGNSPCLLSPGDTNVNIPNFNSVTNFTTITTLTETFGTAGSGGPVGTFYETVFTTPTTKIDFIFQIDLTAGSVAALDLPGFAGFVTNIKQCGAGASYCPGLGMNGALFTGASRSANGDIITVVPATGTSNSSNFVVLTDAPTFGAADVRATITGSDGSQIYLSSLAPAIPEPATWAMLLLGFVGLGLLGRRRVAGRLSSPGWLRRRLPALR